MNVALNEVKGGLRLKLVSFALYDEKFKIHPMGLEASTNQELNPGIHLDLNTATKDLLPSKILCSVMNIQLLAEKDLKVRMQITLVPEQDQSESTSPESYPPEPSTPIGYSFCKVLTASDAGSHDGFIVLKKHAECFPEVDKNQEPPICSTIALELGSQRHVNERKFVSSRGENGELHAGVRRVAPQQCSMQSSVITNQSLHLGVLATVSHVVANGTLFVVFNKPRRSQFIIGLNKYLEAVNNCFGVGMRFKMRFEGEDSLERRFTGTIVGVEDLSSEWKNSEWRSLRVQWDEAATIARPERVSPWEIEPFVPSAPSSLVQPVLAKNKRPRLPIEAEKDLKVRMQITLVPEQDQSESTSPESYPPEPSTPIGYSFCKVLTASDAGSHDGFIVLKKHAECFPEVDKNQEPPICSTIALELGSQRHVNERKFVSSRGENGELHAGVRRVAPQQCSMQSSVITNQSLHLGVLATVSHVVANGTLFVVFNKPRRSQFIIGLNKYLEAVNNCFGVGMRFKMRFEGEDSLERRFTGTIVGVEDLSSEWKNSEWRSLRVQWDEAATIARPERVSPWEIEPFVPSAPSSLVQPVLAKNKRPRLPIEAEKDLKVRMQITLVPEQDQSESTSPESYPPEPSTPIGYSFCKVLTASDAGSHDGFIVLKKHAECFPEVDKNQEPPICSTIALELGSQRHVNERKFVSSRGENGELHAGVRRVAPQQCSMQSSVITNQSLHLGVLATVSHVVANGTLFVVFNKPRRSQFIIGLNKYLEAVNNCFGVGMRFKMRFEGEDSLERRFTGTIVGVEDLSSEWKNSEWRSLRVQWDEAATIARPERVSPWEIEPFVPSAPSSLVQPVLAKNKRPRLPIEVPIHGESHR
ncbi:hypothetical protein Vadar_012893 [Vaccinium darrowii]|uniref:Uncharacterized protein n=1 Tax=Vaccinium darrowii TaxID=229202 RepID=A0ACB7XH73_9ERIC|nr:hypothetical protein Vadar_012893 [Vaccinium darrowii]